MQTQVRSKAQHSAGVDFGPRGPFAEPGAIKNAPGVEGPPGLSGSRIAGPEAQNEMPRKMEIQGEAREFLGEGREDGEATRGTGMRSRRAGSEDVPEEALGAAPGRGPWRNTREETLE